jgi:hypothetical protein
MTTITMGSERIAADPDIGRECGKASENAPVNDHQRCRLRSAETSWRLPAHPLPSEPPIST